MSSIADEQIISGGEKPDTRLKRMKMRSWRRGTKEMDLILGPFSDNRLADMSIADLDVYDQLLRENDQDLYQWLTGQGTPPDHLSELIDTIAATTR